MVKSDGFDREECFDEENANLEDGIAIEDTEAEDGQKANRFAEWVYVFLLGALLGEVFDDEPEHRKGKQMCSSNLQKKSAP